MDTAIAGAVAAILIAAGLHDLRTLRIPNAMPVALAVTFAALALAGRQPEWPEHLATGLAFLLLGFGLFTLGLWGGGDGKLLAAAALWAGPAGAAPLLLVMALSGGALALLTLATSGRADRARPVPYGLAIAAGGVAALGPVSTVLAGGAP